MELPNFQNEIIILNENSEISKHYSRGEKIEEEWNFDAIISGYKPLKVTFGGYEELNYSSTKQIMQAEIYRALSKRNFGYQEKTSIDELLKNDVKILRDLVYYINCFTELNLIFFKGTGFILKQNKLRKDCVVEIPNYEEVKEIFYGYTLNQVMQNYMHIIINETYKTLEEKNKVEETYILYENFLIYEKERYLQILETTFFKKSVNLNYLKESKPRNVKVPGCTVVSLRILDHVFKESSLLDTMDKYELNLIKAIRFNYSIHYADSSVSNKQYNDMITEESVKKNLKKCYRCFLNYWTYFSIDFNLFDDKDYSNKPINMSRAEYILSTIFRNSFKEKFSFYDKLDFP